MAPVSAMAEDPFTRTDPPRLTLDIWPHRSLTQRGFRNVLAITAAGLGLPLIAVSAVSVQLFLLPFIGLTFAGLWWFLRRNYADAGLTETLRLWEDAVTVERIEPDGRRLKWHANPYWVAVRLHTDARIENYLTLEGNGREIEIGAFLSPWERSDLFHEIRAAIGKLRTPH